jgi:hypothetical protein
MDSILITPSDSKEFNLISKLLLKRKIRSQIISLEEKEDFYFGELLKEADRTKKVSRDNIMKKLKS